MRADESGMIVGVALESFDGTNALSEGVINMLEDNEPKSAAVVQTEIITDTAKYTAGEEVGKKPVKKPKASPSASPSPSVSESPKYTAGTALSENVQTKTVKIGKILVFVSLGWHQLDSAISDGEFNYDEFISGGTGQATPFTGSIDAQAKDIINVRSMVSASGNWYLGDDGTLIVKRVETESIKIKGEALSSATILSGTERYRVENAKVKSTSRVFVTFRGNAGNWWISEQGDGYFEIQLSGQASRNLVFDYWIIDSDSEQGTTGVVGYETPTPMPTQTPTPEITPEPSPPPAEEAGQAEPTPESMPQPTPEPTLEPTPESTPEPTLNPTIEPTPEPQW
jgi:hypothetical protein